MNLNFLKMWQVVLPYSHGNMILNTGIKLRLNREIKVKLNIVLNREIKIRLNIIM